MTRLKKPSWRDVDWENALEGVCVAGVYYVYAALKRVKNAGKTLLGVARTPIDVFRLIRRMRGKTGTVDVYQVQACRRATANARRRRIQYNRTLKKVASFPLRNL